MREGYRTRQFSSDESRVLSFAGRGFERFQSRDAPQQSPEDSPKTSHGNEATRRARSRHRKNAEEVEHDKTNEELGKLTQRMEQVSVPGLNEVSDPKRREQAHQIVFNEGKSFLDKECGKDVDDVWTYSISWSLNPDPSFTFTKGVWKVRMNRRDPWTDPATVTPPWGRGQKAVQQILNELARLNDLSAGEYPQDQVSQHLQYQGVPLVLDPQGLKTVAFKGDGIAIRLPHDGFFCAEIDPGSGRELWGKGGHCAGVGAVGRRVCSIRLNAGREATIAFWPYARWSADDRKKYKPVFAVKLVKE